MQLPQDWWCFGQHIWRHSATTIDVTFKCIKLVLWQYKQHPHTGKEGTLTVQWKSRQARINVTPPELLVLWQYIRRHLTSVTPPELMVLWQHIWRHLATTVDVTFQVHQGSTLTVQAASSYRIGSTLTVQAASLDRIGNTLTVQATSSDRKRSTLTVQATSSDRKESTLTVHLAAQSNTIQLKHLAGNSEKTRDNRTF